MEIRRGTQLIENGTKQAIIEFVFTDYIIYVFQGTLSQFDIVIKYKKRWNAHPHPEAHSLGSGYSYENTGE